MDWIDAVFISMLALECWGLVGSIHDFMKPRPTHK